MNPTRDLIAMPTIDDVTRRGLLSTALTAALLIACGDDDGAEETAQQPAGGRRTITHDAGTITLQGPPQRVVSYYERVDLAHLLALGVKPVGYFSLGDPPDYIRSRVEGIPTARITFAQPDLELLASWRPDLIVGLGYVTPEEYERMNSIAPAIALPGFGGVGKAPVASWADELRLIGQALYRDAEAEKLIAQTTQIISDAKARLTAKGTPPSVSVIFGRPDGTVSLVSTSTRVPNIMSQLGLGAPAGIPGLAGNLSLERLGEIPGDRIVGTTRRSMVRRGRTLRTNSWPTRS